ncbi:MAG TPA: DUF1467 family protein [Alphaproteobacteria bacterium]|nr:DUF1467 family protein [Micavibrio sp.]HPQ50754.1 DUF1467 family protein [Alphaproteobacteria bacterium]HRK97272.1 DUF1467 family protein [Alphaproteobacteria bacterium]
MGWISGIVVFLMIWWVTLFTVLPWGNRPSSSPQEGNMQSAPDLPRLGKKFLVTTLISCLLWVVVYGLIASNVISFHDMAAKMAEQDNLMESPQ